jgi:hypothetical protein
VQFEHERGYLVIAQNTDTVDYVRCARVLARSLRRVEPEAKICLLTDSAEIDVPEFDFVRSFPFGDNSGDSAWKLHNDWQCFYATPFRQTIKIEADMIVPHSIAHWFDICQSRDLALTVGARNWRNELSGSRYYRKVFDDNDLPDVYNAITYWRFSRDAEMFFNMVKNIMGNWTDVMSELKFAADQPVNTDLAYAVAAKTLGVEKFTLPLSVPSMIHLKPRFNGLATESWQQELIWEILEDGVRINTVNQLWPIHYQEKNFVEELERHYG